MASYSFTKTRSPVLGICILTLTTLYRHSFNLNAVTVYTTLVSGGRLSTGRYTGTINRFFDGLAGRDNANVYLPFPGQPDTSYEARAEVDHPAIDSGHVSVGVEHYCPPVRCCRVTSWSGRPSKTSEGKYRCCFPHSGQVTIIDWNGNSFTAEGTAR